MASNIWESFGQAGIAQAVLTRTHMLADALLLDLQEQYPSLGFHNYIFTVGQTLQLTSRRGLVLVLLGSRVFMTTQDTGFLMAEQIPGTVVRITDPILDIDLAQPGSLDLLYEKIRQIWLF